MDEIVPLVNRVLDGLGWPLAQYRKWRVHCLAVDTVRHVLVELREEFGVGTQPFEQVVSRFEALSEAELEALLDKCFRLAWPAARVFRPGAKGPGQAPQLDWRWWEYPAGNRWAVEGEEALVRAEEHLKGVALLEFRDEVRAQLEEQSDARGHMARAGTHAEQDRLDDPRRLVEVDEDHDETRTVCTAEPSWLPTAMIWFALGAFG